MILTLILISASSFRILNHMQVKMINDWKNLSQMIVNAELHILYNRKVWWNENLENLYSDMILVREQFGKFI